MIARCTNPRHLAFKYYGARGITVCESWRDFENFLADMGERPEGRTLDRKDNGGNYEPSNCRWATRSEQSLNRRRREVCKKGHALSGDNLYIAPGRPGTRQCRICKSEASQWRERRSAKQHRRRATKPLSPSSFLDDNRAFGLPALDSVGVEPPVRADFEGGNLMLFEQPIDRCPMDAQQHRHFAEVHYFDHRGLPKPRSLGLA